MAEYIEREALLDRVYTVKDKLKLDLDNLFEDGVRIGFENVEIEIGNYPAADVRPVVRGKWKPRDLTWGRSYYYCSACEETVDMPTAMGIPMFRYCPNCGADMRET